MLLLLLFVLLFVITIAVQTDSEYEKCEIFLPQKRYNFTDDMILVQPPELWLKYLKKTFEHLAAITHDGLVNEHHSFEHKAKFAYQEMLIPFISGAIFGLAERSVYPKLRAKPLVKVFDQAVRDAGNDWSYMGVSMSGKKRLANVAQLIKKVIRSKIAGDYIETGVWRGGSSIYARGILRAYGHGHIKSYVGDSFAGLPYGDNKLHFAEEGYDGTAYLEVDARTVANNFHRFGLLDDKVVFVKGFFNDTMGELSKQVDKLAIMRLDGDMYSSTVDVLYRLYEKLSIGGYVIIDDWADNFGAKKAVLDFMSVHVCNDLNKMVMIDDQSMYWQKETAFAVNQRRYELKKFTEPLDE